MATVMAEDTTTRGVCCMCGVSMVANKVNTCAQCLQTNHDVTSEFSKNGVLLKCKGCDRYQKATQGWVLCRPESQALLALCLARIKGLKKVSLVNANFIWTEEHSKRIKVKLVVQKEVTNGVVLQQTCVVEFVVQGKMCEDCHMQEANVQASAVVQVRQKVEHKRTFLFLEQIILKHGEDSRTVKVEAMPDGVDFWFSAKNDAVRFLDFLETVVPLQYKTSKKIVSMDIKSNLANFNHTWSVEIVPICKDDLLVLPAATARKMGNVSQLVLCANVSNVIRFIDPLTCQVCDLSAERFWQRPFRSLLTTPQLVTFVVLDVQIQERPAAPPPAQIGHESEKLEAEPQAPLSKKRRRKNKAGGGTVLTSTGVNVSPKHALALVEIAREEDFGVNDKRFEVLSHLGFVLKPGDSVLGYDVATLNANDEEADRFQARKGMPDVVLVRKCYPKFRKQVRKREWKLKSLVVNGPQEAGFLLAKEGEKKDDNLERDRELFMRDLEEDEEMRSRVNLYRAEAAPGAAPGAGMTDGDEDEDDVEKDAPVIAVETLLDEMALSGSSQAGAAEAAEDAEDADL